MRLSRQERGFWRRYHAALKAREATERKTPDLFVTQQVSEQRNAHLRFIICRLAAKLQDLPPEGLEQLTEHQLEEKRRELSKRIAERSKQEAKVVAIA